MSKVPLPLYIRYISLSIFHCPPNTHISTVWTMCSSSKNTVFINMNHLQELRNVSCTMISPLCPLVVELHVVVDELCCYQEQDYNH